MYKIRAVNEHGQDEAEVEVTVLGKFIYKKFMINIIYVHFFLLLVSNFTGHTLSPS